MARCMHVLTTARVLLPQVRDTFGPEWGDGEVRITPENPSKIRVPEYLRTLGQHRFVLSPRGNGLDAHRTWEALMVGTIPICLMMAPDDGH